MMKAQLRAVVKFEQNDQVRLLLMVEFTYNNTKNTSTSHISFELNCRYYLRIFYEKDVDFCSKLKLADQLLQNLQELITVCQENLQYAQ